VILVFFATFLLSAWGSLQPGVVNSLVAQTTLNNGRKQGIRLAFWMVLPEFFYSALALLASRWFMQHAGFQQVISSLFPFVLIGLGLFLYLQPTAKGNAVLSPLKGALLAFTNVQLPLFWMGMALALSATFHWDFTQTGNQIAFVAGTGLGALAMLLVWVFVFARLARTRIGNWPFQKIFGATLGLIGILGITT
jgi:threonine/homoserine/homoserine lactone efflux protein